MGLDKETELSPAETDALVGRHETGVLSMASGDEPYGIPISYGYDADDRAFYLRLVSTPDSEKRRFLASGPRANLVVYEADGDRYSSAIASGRLEEIDPSELTVTDVEQFGAAKRPLFEIWGESRAALEIQLYRLDPEELSGRRIVLDRDADR